MRRPAGYNVWSGPDTIFEMDSFQCAHCGRHMRLKPGMTPSDVGGWCLVEGKPLCNKPSCNNGCMPLDYKMTLYEQGKLAELN